MDDVIISHDCHAARGIGSNTFVAVPKHVVKISNVFARGAFLFEFVIIYSGSMAECTDAQSTRGIV